MTELLNKIYEALTDVKLKDIVIYDFRNHSPYFDYQIIASATSERQANAVINHIKEALPNNYEMHAEGTQNNRWVLIDLKSIIVHVMHVEDREFYQLEKIFYEREKISLEDNHGL